MNSKGLGTALVSMVLVSSGLLVDLSVTRTAAHATTNAAGVSEAVAHGATGVEFNKPTLVRLSNHTVDSVFAAERDSAGERWMAPKRVAPAQTYVGSADVVAITTLGVWLHGDPLLVRPRACSRP